jgi:hypothetical protein
LREKKEMIAYRIKEEILNNILEEFEKKFESIKN